MMLPGLSGALLAVALPFAIPDVAGTQPETSLVLTVVTSNGDSESVGLSCDPPDGTHPNAKHACAELHAAQGDFESLPGEQEQTMCTMEYLPVTAQAEGTWHGEQVTWQQEFGNACTLRTATGAVFRF
jgi:hypothetical protein